MKLIFATNNKYKINEISAVLKGEFELLTLEQSGIDIDLPEPHLTLEENASEKSKTIYRLTRNNCFSEDTGLEVHALNGEPGVKSARYAGEDKSFQKNIDKLLQNLEDNKDRKARFRTILSLIIDGKETMFEGICDGVIIKETRGLYGFGYDSVFIPLGSEKTFAEMEMEEKNKYSHRKKALDKLLSFLKKRE